MSNIVGRFYFKLDENENLRGEFSNNRHLINYEEKAIRVTGNGFIGEFNSTWTEENSEIAHAKLNIGLKINSRDIYTLNWENTFFGEGFIVGDTLIGDYRNFSTIK